MSNERWALIELYRYDLIASHRHWQSTNQAVLGIQYILLCTVFSEFKGALFCSLKFSKLNSFGRGIQPIDQYCQTIWISQGSILIVCVPQLASVREEYPFTPILIFATRCDGDYAIFVPDKL